MLAILDAACAIEKYQSKLQELTCEEAEEMLNTQWNEFLQALLNGDLANAKETDEFIRDLVRSFQFFGFRITFTTCYHVGGVQHV